MQVNKVDFSVTGLGNLAGSLTIAAKFKAVSEKRVSITFETATLVRLLETSRFLAVPTQCVVLCKHTKQMPAIPDFAGTYGSSFVVHKMLILYTSCVYLTVQSLIL